MQPEELRILAKFAFPAATAYFWDGSHLLSSGGHLWHPVKVAGGLTDELQDAFNGQDASLTLRLMNLSPEAANLAFGDYAGESAIGGVVTFYVQEIGRDRQPMADPEAVWTAEIVDAGFGEENTGDTIVAETWVELRSLFQLRNLASAAVLSNQWHQIAHPGDKFFERVPHYLDKTLRWPDFA